PGARGQAQPPQHAGGPGPAALTLPGTRFRSVAKSYFRKAHGVLLLYDISSESSFLSVRQWIEDIKAHSALFCETSAKDGTNVVEAVLHLAREVKRTAALGKGDSAGLDLSIPPRAALSCCRT
ncbi:RASEF protein, partial [Dromaius novaehollandiae]|nr:RASEF protein [Dromaius novaehollandiae]